MQEEVENRTLTLVVSGTKFNLKRPVQPRSTDKKPKQHEEVR